MTKTEELYRKAKELIPGGAQLLSKRPEQFLPGVWPAYYSKAKGCRITDLDGRTYLDFSLMGVGANILGYADDDVDEAVRNVISNGSMSTLNAPEEVELAELLLGIHPWADNVRYARTGGEAMSVAVRIVRASTNKSIILFCGYHGWHDWYLASNLADNNALDGHLLKGLSPKGVPRGLSGTSLPFHYNNIDELDMLISKYDGEIAAVVMEPVRNYPPEHDFLGKVKDRCVTSGIPLVFDEISSGWRNCIGGAHLMYNVEPDLAVFAKGISNGYPMAAIIGKERIMSIAQESFISSTYWTERIGPTAAIASIKKMVDKNIPEVLNRNGRTVQEAWRSIASKYSIDISLSGLYPMGHFEFNHKEKLVLKSLFTQYMLDKGFLATNSYYASYAHSTDDINQYILALEEVFKEIRENLNSDGNLSSLLINEEVCHSGFQRLA